MAASVASPPRISFGEAPRAAPSCHQNRERNGEVIGDALLQAERTRREPDHKLEEIGAEQGRDADERDREGGEEQRRTRRRHGRMSGRG